MVDRSESELCGAILGQPRSETNAVNRSETGSGPSPLRGSAQDDKPRCVGSRNCRLAGTDRFLRTAILRMGIRYTSGAAPTSRACAFIDVQANQQRGFGVAKFLVERDGKIF